MAAPNPAPGFTKHPSHRVAIRPCEVRVRAVFQGETVAESRWALIVEEDRHSPVYYFPRDDARMERMERTDHSTYCPFKGHASYWTLRVGERAAENAVWSYEAPYDECLALAGYVAFYADRLDEIGPEA
jgi:uncharacterized protein (DUF427 family)